MSRRDLRRLPRIDRPLLLVTIHQPGRTGVPPTIHQVGRNPARATTRPPGKTGIRRPIHRAGRSRVRATTRPPGKTGLRSPIRPAGRSRVQATTRPLGRTGIRHRIPRAGRSPARATTRQLTAPRRPTARTAPGHRLRNPAPILPRTRAAGVRWIGTDKPAPLHAATPGTSPVQVPATLRFQVVISARRARPERAISN